MKSLIDNFKRLAFGNNELRAIQCFNDARVNRAGNRIINTDMEYFFEYLCRTNHELYEGTHSPCPLHGAI